ncbi:unnamed protein product [Caenorhabditis bovis]|uniref:DAGKc domain-containing protein n=1 Tax=Caenorhabditis bovis TaxID=2654633 RepID=A0A8S1F1W2_9PELO|nr:unnamed protein product [Caenorhabditis bovis]
MGGALCCCCPKVTDRENEQLSTVILSRPQPNIEQCRGNLLVFLNPNSGRGLSLKTFAHTVAPKLDKNLIKYEVVITNGPNHAKYALMTKTDLDKFNGVLIFSGDGLVFEALNGILNREDAFRIFPTLPFGIIPSGSGNGLLSSVLNKYDKNIKPKEVMEKALEICTSTNPVAEAVALYSVKTDAGPITSFLSIGWGLMADIDIESEKWRRHLGGHRFTLQGFIRSINLRSYHGRLTYRPYRPSDTFTPSENKFAIYDKTMGERIADLESQKVNPISLDKWTLHEENPDDSTDLVTIEDEFINVYAVTLSHISSDGPFAPTCKIEDNRIFLSYILKKDVGSRYDIAKYLLAIEEMKHLDLPFVKFVEVSSLHLDVLTEGSYVVIDGEVIETKTVIANSTRNHMCIMLARQTQIRQNTLHRISKRFVAWRDSFREGTFSSDVDAQKPTHIIVGAGSAGCVLANRLTENPDNRVLLIEAGPVDHKWDWRIHMPAALMYNLCSETYNWYYHTTAQKNLNNRVFYWPRGRVWGGSSTLNAMCYVRGHAFDYNRWEKEGADGWNYANCLPYFRKAETYSHTKGPDDPYRGHNGPLHVQRGAAENPLHKAWLDVGKNHPLGYTEDMNGEKQEGIGYMDMTIHKGERWSSSKAYLHPILSRPNLITSSGIMCTRVLFDKNKAIGIEYIRKINFMGTENIDSYSREKVYCQGDVILAGGAINTPQLLMLSGVGPSEHLRSHEIPLVVDLPGVGKNLQDHLEIYVQQECTQPVTLYNKSSWKFPHNMIKIGLEWFTRRTGLGASSHLETGGFARSNDTVSHPDIQFHFLPSTVHDDGRVNGTCHGYQVHVGPMRSQSKGYLMLQSKDPRRAPIINPNYMNEDDDWKEFRRCIRLSRELFASKSFDEFRGKELAPGEEAQSDADIDKFVKEKAASAYHPSCTCKMGKSDDSMAVVNPNTMGVYGTENLKVVDASVMPSIVSGNLNAPVIMMAERAADLILHKKQQLPPSKAKVWTH